MAEAYSQDLRTRAVELIETGMSITQVSRLLKISRPTLYRWVKQFEATGSTQPKKSIPPPHPSKIQDWQKFQEFIELHGDKTQKEMASLWGDVSHHTIRSTGWRARLLGSWLAPNISRKHFPSSRIKKTRLYP